MKDYYIEILINAVLEGKALILRHYHNDKDGGLGDWDLTGIAISRGSLTYPSLVCHWPSDCSEAEREITFQEAKKLIEEKFHGPYPEICAAE